MTYAFPATLRIARRDHVCDLCGRVISKGDVHPVWTVREDAWYTVRAHRSCYCLAGDGTSHGPTGESVASHLALAEQLHPLAELYDYDPDLVRAAIARLPDGLRAEARENLEARR